MSAIQHLYAGPFYRIAEGGRTDRQGAGSRPISLKAVQRKAGKRPLAAEEMVDFLSGHIALKGRRILEVRCKSGAFLAQAAAAGAVPFGLDDARFNVECCRTLGFSANVLSLDDPAAAAVSGEYDVIRLNNVLAHSPSPTATLRHFAAHLQPKGVLFIEEPDILAKNDGPFPVVPFHHWHPTSRAVEALLAKEGFRVSSQNHRGALLWIVAVRGGQGPLKADPVLSTWVHFTKWRVLNSFPGARRLARRLWKAPLKTVRQGAGQAVLLAKQIRWLRRLRQRFRAHTSDADRTR
jgi:2-polyprenyl-3-methyl-5-hydroxy-6-metoxy-1,4-benzoquinol methylase